MSDTPRAAAERCDECHGCKSYEAGRAAGQGEGVEAFMLQMTESFGEHSTGISMTEIRAAADATYVHRLAAKSTP